MVSMPLLTVQVVHEYADLDSNIIQYVLEVDDSYRQLYIVGDPCSPELEIHLDLINYWRIILNKKQDSCINMKTIIQCQRQCWIWVYKRLKSNGYR